MSLATFALAWRESGSILAANWLVYAVLIALVLAIVLASGTAGAPQRLAVAGISALVLLAAWQAVTIAWAPSPANARDDALLSAFYAIVCALGAVAVRTPRERAVGAGIVAASATALAVAAAAHVIHGHGLESALESGRLYFPIDYANAQAAAFLVGFWPAIAIAARRAAPVVVRAAALGAASALLAGWVFTQSKGGGLALAASAVVVLAVSPARLRLLLPVALAAALAAIGFTRLVAPFRERDTPGFHDAAVSAGWTVLAVAAGAAVVGAAYALADRRIEVGARGRRLAGIAAAAALGLVVVGSIAGLLVAVDHPGRRLADGWHSFKRQPSTETASSHFLTIGSNRYDFWRVAGHEFLDHPVGGIGARGFETAYLLHRRSDESPARAHSFELDALSEDGVVGFALLAVSLGALLAVAFAGTRRRGLTATAALGTGAYFVAHSTVDWTWTFPAVGVPVFLLLGLAGSARDGRALEPRRSLLLAIGAVVVAALALAPPWLSSRLTTSALRSSGAGASDLRWARRLDPLSTAPLMAESVLAPRPEAAITPLQEAVSRETSPGLEYQLALAYERVGLRGQALKSMRAAHRLDPGDVQIAQALQRLARTGG